jgi:hypothetical protein
MWYQLELDKKETFKVDLELWERFKNVEPYMSHQSAYYDPMITWKMDDFNFEEIESSLIMLHLVINNVDMVNIKDIWDYQKSLCKRSYFDYDDESNEMHLAFKRPFGNSNVNGDIIEELVKEYDKLGDKSYLAINFPNVLEMEKYDKYNWFYDNLDEKPIMLELYDVYKSLIKDWKWEYLHYDILHERSWRKVDESKLIENNDLCDEQINKSLDFNGQYCDFFPSKYEMREKSLKLLVD